MRRWVLDEAGWAGARAALALPTEVAEALPPVPAATAAAPITTPPVEATLAPLEAALVVAATGDVVVEVVAHRGPRVVVTRLGCTGGPLGAMTVGAAGSGVAVAVEMGDVQDMVATVLDRLAAVEHHTAPARSFAADVGSLADDERLPDWVRRAVDGPNRDVLRVDGPAGTVAATLLYAADGPVWVRADTARVDLRTTTRDALRQWLVRAVAAQLATLGAAHG